jgi:hypothetical protein
LTYDPKNPLADLPELADEDLRAIVKMAKTGGNELAQAEAREAERILEERRRKFVREEELKFINSRRSH